MANEGDTLMTGTEGQDAGGQNAGGEAGQQAGQEGQQAPGDGQQQGQQAGQPAGKPADGKKPDQAAGAPEKYEFAQPEGVAFDDAVVGAFGDVAKELDLPQDKAQKVIDRVAPMLAQRQNERLAEANAGWIESTRADSEFGGDALDENLAIAKSAMDAFASPEFKKLLVDTGLGNHPEVIRTFYRAGKRISEAGYAGGKGKGQVPDASPQNLYRNSNMNP